MPRGKRLDLAGKTFGNLTVLDNYRYDRTQGAMWLCRCTCGSLTWKCADNLRRGIVRSCSVQHRWNGVVRDDKRPWMFGRKK